MKRVTEQQYLLTYEELTALHLAARKACEHERGCHGCPLNIDNGNCLCKITQAALMKGS